MAAQYVNLYLDSFSFKMRPRRIKKRGRIHFVVRNLAAVTHEAIFIDTSTAAADCVTGAAFGTATLNSLAALADLVFTAKTRGTTGNGITVATVDGGTAALSVSVVGSVITISLTTTPVANVDASVLLDSIAANSDITFTAVAHGVAGNSIAIHTVNNGSTGLEVSVVGRVITVKVPIAHSTANQVVAAVAANADAAALVTGVASGTGAGNVSTGLSVTTTGGVDVQAASTGNLVKAAVDASAAAHALVSVAVQGAGTGLVDPALSQDTAGGLNGTVDESFGNGKIDEIELAAGRSGILVIDTADSSFDHIAIVCNEVGHFNLGMHTDLNFKS